MRTKLFTGPLAVVIGLVASAFMAGPALATNTAPDPGFVEICKDAPAVTPAATFDFRITDARGNQMVSVTSGQCSQAIQVVLPTNHQITVTELGHIDAYTADSFPHAITDFNTNEWTDVTAIHTVAPGAPDEMLMSANLTQQTAVVGILPDTTQSQTTVVHFQNDPVNGYFEICKDQVTAAGLDGQSFAFNWVGANGTGGTVSVPVSGCSLPILAPAGHVIVTEQGTNYVDTTTDASGHPGIWGVHSGDLIASSVPSAIAVVKVTGAMVGDMTSESIVHFRNNSALLKICKVVPKAVQSMIGTTYSFNVSASGTSAGSYSVMPTSVYDGSNMYGCVVAGTFRAGTSMSVTEAPQPGQAVQSIWLVPAGNLTTTLSATPTKDYAGQSGSFTIQAGDNELFFQNTPIVDPLLKICKTGGPANGTVTFTVTGKQFLPPPGLDPSKAALVDAPALVVHVVLDSHGSGCIDNAGYWAYIGPVQVVETIPASYHVTAITTSTPDRLKSANLGTGTALVYIGYGTTQVTFANTDPPATDAGTGSSGGSGSASSSPSPVVTATPTSQPAPVAPAPAKPTKATVASHVMSVRIVTLHGKRYVSIRMASSNKTARVHLQLIDRHGTVMKNAVRTVKANVTTRILDLPLAKAIVKIRAIPVS